MSETSSADSEVVYISNTGNGNGSIWYHTDPDCYRLQSANSSREVTKDALFDNATECSNCSGDVETPPGYGYGHFESLKQAAEDDGSNA